MSIYEKNLSTLKKNHEDLYKAITGENIKADEKAFFVETARNGMPVLYTEQDGKEIYLSSRYDPEREAERYVEKYKYIYDYSVMFFFGLGNGFVAKKLIEEKGKHINYIFYEPCSQLFLLVLHHFDLTSLFECSRFRLIVSGLNDKNLDEIILDKVSIENYRICLYNIIPPYERIYEEETRKIAYRFFYAVGLVGQNIGTSGYFEKLLTYNNILNMREVFRSNCEEQFTGIFPVDRPAIVVGAGPSLERNVEYLKKAKGKLLILAVDSALPYLNEKGVQPDIVFTVDAMKPLKIFEKEAARKVSLAIISCSNPEIVRMMEGKIIFISSSCDYYSKMYQRAGKNLYSLISGGNVATMAFYMAIAWGYRKIVLVGQDLAISKEKMHAGKVDETLGTTEIEEEFIEVEGYYGEKVYSLPDYNSYRQWYETVIRNDQKIEVINATEGGAKIEGTIQMPLKDVIEDCEVESFDFEKVIREMPPVFNREQRKEIVHMWRQSVENLDILKRKLYDGIRLLNGGISLMKSKQFKQAEINRIQKRVKDIAAECDAMNEMYFLNEIVAGDYADVLGDIYVAKEDDTEERCRLFDKMLSYMKAMHGSVDEVKELFEKIIVEETQEIKDDGGII